MIPSLFVSGVSTTVGKTFVSRALSSAIRRAGRSVVALKPIETGVTNEPADAIALARACGVPALADEPGFYRHALPLAPYAAALQSGTPPPDLSLLAQRIRDLSVGVDHLVVEGAGGLLVPLDARRTTADLVLALGHPLLLVARDELGVLASVLSCVESARARDLPITAIVLTMHRAPDLQTDPSPLTNRRILEERLELPVLSFQPCPDDDRALAAEAARCGLLELML